MKLKLLIAGDSSFDSDKLMEIIDFEKISLDLVGISKNNDELLNLVETLRPELIIMDISKSNDLECIWTIKQKDNKCKFIITSTQRRFEYAYKAFKYGVEDYILQPIKPEELNFALSRSAEKIRHNIDTIIARDHSEAIRQLFVDKMNSAEINSTKKPLEEINRIYGTLFFDGLFCVIFVRVDYLHDSKLIFDIFPELHQKIIELIEDHLRKYCNDILFNRRFNEIMALLNFPVSNDVVIRNEFSKLLESTKKATGKFGNLGVTISVGGTYDNISMIKKTREEAHNAAWTRMSRGAGKVLFWEKQGECPELLSKKLKTLDERMKKACEVLNVKEFRKCAEELFSLPDAMLTRMEAKECALGTLDYFFKVNNDLIESFTDTEKLYDEIKQAIVVSCTFDQYKSNLITQFAKLFKLLIDFAEGQNAKPVRQAIKFVEGNYEKKINLEIVSKEVNLSPVYFSHIFKKETDLNFTEYVNGYKMKVAKDILKKSDMNINEVAYALGYSDQRYFSKLFRKIVGVNPTTYKKLYK